MRYTHYFIHTSREAPSGAKIVSHQLMLRAGLIYQTCSGVYCWLPLALRVMEKISKIISQEQEHIKSWPVLLSTVQSSSLWQRSGRYGSYGKEMLRFQDRKGNDFLYSPTNEEQMTDLFGAFVESYKSLPVRLFQIHWKFRDEIRPRFGVMRGREFLMKDGYSFDLDEESAFKTYMAQFDAYLRTFRRMGLHVVPVMADSGAIGGNMSHEFHVLAEGGENEVFFHKSALDQTMSAESLYNSPAFSDEQKEKMDIDVSHLESARSIEIGHLFYFSRKYTESMQISVCGVDGKRLYPEMGSYGIGVSRLIAAIIEASHDEKGIIWPHAVAPFDIHMMNVFSSEDCVSRADALYKRLQEVCDVLYDDRDVRVGQKYADADLLGIPYQVIVGRRDDDMYEFKHRINGHVDLLPIDDLIGKIIDIKRCKE